MTRVSARLGLGDCARDIGAWKARDTGKKTVVPVEQGEAPIVVLLATTLYDCVQVVAPLIMLIHV